MSELENMLSGRPYVSADPELVAMRARTRRLLRAYNATASEVSEQRRALLEELLGQASPGVYIEPPFYCDYGSFIFLGDNVYMNFNCVILDCNHVRIGAGTMLGPAVQIYAATHSTDPVVRAAGPELAFPITIGAGSVVTRSIPANVVAVGNPCRVVKTV